MISLTDRNVSKLGKFLAVIAIVGGALYAAAAAWGLVGFNLGPIEAGLMLLLGAFILSESVVEDAAKFRKMNPVVVGEAIVGALILLYGLGLVMSNATITGLISPYKAYLLAVGAVIAALETMTKL